MTSSKNNGELPNTQIEVVTKPTTAIPNGSEGSDFLTSTTKDDSASLTTSEHRYEWVGLLGSSQDHRSKYYNGGLFFYRLRFGERTEVRQHTTVKILPLVSTTVSSLTRSSPLTTSQTTQATTTKITTTTTHTTPSTTATTPVPQPTTTASRPRVKFVVTQTRTSTRVTQVPTTTAPVITATSQRTTVPTTTATTTTAKSTATSTKRTTSDTARSTTTPKPTVQV